MQNASFDFNGFQSVNRRLDLNWRPLGCVGVVGARLFSHGFEVWSELGSEVESELDFFLIVDLRCFRFCS